MNELKQKQMFSVATFEYLYSKHLFVQGQKQKYSSKRHFTPISRVSIVDFEQIDFCWFYIKARYHVRIE